MYSTHRYKKMGIQDVRVSRLDEDEKEIARQTKNHGIGIWFDVDLPHLSLYEIKRKVLEFGKKHSIRYDCNIHREDNLVLFARSRRRKSYESMILNAMGYKSTIPKIMNKTRSIPDDIRLNTIEFLESVGKIKKLKKNQAGNWIYINPDF